MKLGNESLKREQIIAYLRGVVDVVVQVRKVKDRRVVSAIYYKHLAERDSDP